MTKKDYVFIAEILAIIEMGYMTHEDLKYYIIENLKNENSLFDEDTFQKYIQDLKNENKLFKYF